MLQIVSIICLISSIGLTGCWSTKINIDNREWILPKKPKLERIKFTPVDNGFFLEYDDAIKLANNLDELKAHIEKQDVLLREIKNYYK